MPGLATRGAFLDLVESMDASDASVGRLFGGEGLGMGRANRGRRSNPEWEARVTETAWFLAEIYSGQRPAHHLREALGTADFPLLFGDIIDRQLLANYLETPQTYREYMHMATVSDFRTVKRFGMNNAEGVLPSVAMQTEYPEVRLTDQAWQYAVGKYGKRIPFAWEAMINDDLDALKDIPARFGRSARRTEEKFATQLFCDVNGPISTFYTSGNKNIVNQANGATLNNPPLSIQALQDAWTILLSQRDADGEPIVISAVHLVIPPALQIIAENILGASELWINLATATTSPVQQQLHTANWMKGKLKPHTNFYIPIIAPGAAGMTSWWLIADPGASRPAFEFAFLRGHEQPEIFMKEPNSVRIGGGGVTPMDGDFDFDSIQYKVRHVMGGTQLDYRATVASNGSST
jgi:hypothetical protein